MSTGGLTLGVKLLDPRAEAPRYMSEAAAGLDLVACLGQPVRLEPGERTMIPTGLAIELPPRHEGQVRPRSGLAVKRGVTVVNAPGTIDEDYRGEVKVALINLGSQPFLIEHGMRVAQLVVAPVARVTVSVHNELSETARGAGGFGHTGEGGRS